MLPTVNELSSDPLDASAPQTGPRGPSDVCPHWDLSIPCKDCFYLNLQFHLGKWMWARSVSPVGASQQRLTGFCSLRASPFMATGVRRRAAL